MRARSLDSERNAITANARRMRNRLHVRMLNARDRLEYFVFNIKAEYWNLTGTLDEQFKSRNVLLRAL